MAPFGAHPSTVSLLELPIGGVIIQFRHDSDVNDRIISAIANAILSDIDTPESWMAGEVFTVIGIRIFQPVPRQVMRAEETATLSAAEMLGYRLHEQGVLHPGHHCENRAIPASRHLRMFSASRFKWEVSRMASAESGVVVMARRDRKVDLEPRCLSPDHATGIPAP